MFSLKIDTNGSYQVRWPSRQADILALGAAYVAFETSLPANKQVLAPSLTLIQDTLVAAQAKQTTANSGEAARAAAAETYRQTLALVKNKLNIALLQLKAKNDSNLALLEAWGVHTVAAASGISVRKPHSDSEWRNLLTHYITQETSLDAASRLADPPLTEMNNIAAALQAADMARKVGKNQREAAVQTRTAAADRLLDLLQGAALIIVLTQYEGIVTSDLQQWGFNIVARTPAEPVIIEPTP